MPGRKYTAGSAYRYGFNGQEKSTELNQAFTTAEFWEYDSRIGRRWNVEPVIAKYPNLSGYVVFANDPVNLQDPDGKDIIYVNGYRLFGTMNADDRNWKDPKKLKDTYWNSVNKDFNTEVSRYFNDGKSQETEHYVSGDHNITSSAHSRIIEGKKIGIQMVSSGEIKVSKTNNIMTIVMHSQGNAEGLGIAMGIIEQAKKQGVDVTVNLVFLSVHQPEGINDKLTANLAKRGIQFTYANDNATILKPQAGVEGNPILKSVVDAKPEKKNWKRDGRVAHSATVDDAGALKKIEKVDQEKHIFVGKSDTPKS